MLITILQDKNQTNKQKPLRLPKFAGRATHRGLYAEISLQKN